MNVRLTRLTDNDHTRTTVVEGVATSLPMVGRGFTLMNDKPLLKIHGENMRVVSTSYVQYVIDEGGGVYTFQTENTKYKLEVLP